MSSEQAQKFDVVIIGGGIIGPSIAYNILMQAPGATACVVEPDPTYAFASALRSSGGCRVQFTCPENLDGRANVCTPVTNAQLVYRLLLDKKNISTLDTYQQSRN